MPTQNPQSGDNKQIVQRFIEQCWNEGKTNQVNDFLADNIRIHDPVFPNLTSGANNFRQHIETTRRAFPDLKFTIDDTISERNEVVVQWTARGTHKGDFLGMHPTNRKANVTGTSIYRLEGGRIVEEWAHWNLMSMMEQLGLAPAMQEQPGEHYTTKTHA
jgi:steroid delta-isomerase-like uncharacterized protein